ncbi:Sulfite oxidase, mitochondrial, partial [Tetrabaena socialis]
DLAAAFEQLVFDSAEVIGSPAGVMPYMSLYQRLPDDLRLKTRDKMVAKVARILASPSEYGGHWQQRDYKSFSPSTDWDTVDWDSAPAIQEPPVTSAVCEPEPGTVLSASDGEVTVRGYAWSGGGRGIVRVDVTADGGASWTTARLLPPPPGAPPPGSVSGAWAWTLWEVRLLPRTSAPSR